MFSPRVKTGVFVLEGLNAFATGLYFNYLFFHMRDRFGFTNLENLTLCAVNGLVYATAVWFGGKFAQRRGYFVALRLGFLTMGLALAAGSQLRSVAGHYAAMITWTLGMCLTWPSLEAITSEEEPPGRLQRLIGIYNVVWSSATGLATFVGGALMEHLGPATTFLLPAGLHGLQFALVSRLHREVRQVASSQTERPRLDPGDHTAERQRSPIAPKTFLVMAWLANPFAYVALNAIIPVIPGIARKFGLSPTWAGVFCSVWLLARASGFVIWWQWTGWHYRFRWLFGAYLTMAACFAVILLSSTLWLLVAAQALFGVALALIYYSSLYYSMDVGETKGEHGGFHEAALGLGVFAGPAVGAASLHLFPAHANMNAWAVTLLLTVGLAALGLLRWRGRRDGSSAC